MTKLLVSQLKMGNKSLVNCLTFDGCSIEKKLAQEKSTHSESGLSPAGNLNAEAFI